MCVTACSEGQLHSRRVCARSCVCVFKLSEIVFGLIVLYFFYDLSDLLVKLLFALHSVSGKENVAVSAHVLEKLELTK